MAETSLPIESNVTNEAAVPFPNPSRPEDAPFGKMDNPQHISFEVWQASYYDPTSQDPVSVYVKRPAGPLSLDNGRFTGEGFGPPSHHHWKQV